MVLGVGQVPFPVAEEPFLEAPCMAEYQDSKDCTWELLPDTFAAGTADDSALVSASFLALPLASSA